MGRVCNIQLLISKLIGECLSPKVSLVGRQLGVVGLGFGRCLGIADNDRVDSTAHDGEKCRAHGVAHDESNNECFPICCIVAVTDNVARGDSKDCREQTYANADHEQDCIQHVIGDDTGPSSKK
jgi:hypothetical protein